MVHSGELVNSSSLSTSLNEKALDERQRSSRKMRGFESKLLIKTKVNKKEKFFEEAGLFSEDSEHSNGK